MGDRTEALDQFLFGHADSKVLNGDGIGGVVGGYLDFKLEVFVENLLLGDFKVTELF